MPYVSKCRHDLFLSYSHKDDRTWIAAFQNNLVQELQEKLGADPDVWQDTRNIRVGNDWVGEIEEAIAGSAVFVAILSPGYQNSSWCARERKAFLDRFASFDEMKVPLKSTSAYRFLKIVKLPWDDNAHLEFFSQAQHLEFYSRGSDGLDQDLLPGTELFRTRIQQAAYQICALLKAMRRSGESIYVAAPAEDVSAVAEDLRNELAAQRYLVRPEGQLDDLFSDKAIRAEIEPSELSVHLLGAKYDKFAERQVDLAIEHGKRLFFWIPGTAKDAVDPRQKALLKRVRDAEGFTAPFTVLEDLPPRTMIREALNALKPKGGPVCALPSGKTSVYILCDPSSEADSSYARFLRDQIESTEGFRVTLPEVRDGGGRSLDAVHEQKMRECDGVLLYRRTAPLPWLFQQVPNVLLAEKILQRPPLRSRAFLLDDPSVLTGFPGVIPRPAEFSLNDLQGFLAPLRQAEVSHAGD